MGRTFTSIQEVVDSKLCSGCGACAYIQPTEIRMVDVPEEGLRPVTIEDTDRPTIDTSEALKVCPGIELEHPDFSDEQLIDQDLLGAWGPILSIREGGASEDQIRFAGSSGGVASALAIYALEHLDFRLVLHVGADPDTPYTNRTVASRTRDEVLKRSGSRYAPASPCELLNLIEDAGGPCLFIGKPCDVAAAQKARRYRPELDRNLALTVAFFCAGTPSTNGTLELLNALGVPDLKDLIDVRYRGNGWPGDFVAKTRGGGTAYSCSYDQSWGEVLSKHVQWRCKLCLDHTGEFADIAVGDPWYRPIEEGEMGSSLIVARTDVGERYLAKAIENGVLTASRVDPNLLPRSQPNLIRTRGEVWGRMLGARLTGASTPTYRGLHSFGLWLSEVPLPRKARSILGAMRRSIRQKIAFKSKQ
ncbi:Coenzyme F420 hydrogenase/dehydrogenase, beta subunit C-terminal domain [Deltaproteobacteria bacterium]|nr:Coenzyme F420 hydrogenase/dehydrogenase, beta subunit C-terminal domain [Deltaproteobacteria bacterium]